MKFQMRYFHTFIQILKDIGTRPTKYFIYLVLAIIGLFFLAYMHNYNIVYIMMFFTFALAGASSIIGRLNLYEIQASILNAPHFYANTNSTYTLNLFNPNEQRDSFALECDNKSSKSILHELKALQSHSISLSFIPLHRGYAYLPPMRLQSQFPLPHEVLYKQIDLKQECIIYPEPKGKGLDNFSSKHFSYIGEFDDFEGIRSFKEGESLSLMYWPSLAKGQELMAKEFSLLEKSRHLHFYFKQAGKEDEQRLSQLCLWAIECEKKAISYTMHFPDITLHSKDRSQDEILKFLALY